MHGRVSLLRSLHWFVNRSSYKHSAPTELKRIGCGPDAMCLCGEFILAIATTETPRTTEPHREKANQDVARRCVKLLFFTQRRRDAKKNRKVRQVG